MHPIEKLTKHLGGKLVQTHTSWVILLEDLVFKIKKPVNFGFLDYSTLEKRLHYCRREIELNKRLCNDIYIGVVAISDKDGNWILEDDSNPVEYAVKMKRIDDNKLLSSLIDKNEVSEKDIKEVAEVVANFHLSTDKRPEFGKMEVMKFNTDENFEQVAPFIDKTISKEDFIFIKDKTEGFYKKNEKLFEKRISEGKIVDGHGDIRLEHVAFLDGGVCIFDCIEFNERFRCGDMVNDMCFLSMELDFKGRRDLSEIYEKEYLNITNDEDFYTMLPFFKTYRAFVRGKVYSFLSEDKFSSPEVRERAKTLAKSFFKLSREYSENIM